MANKIVSNSGSLILNDSSSVAKGTYNCKLSADGLYVSLHSCHSDVRWNIPFDGTTLDGASFTDGKSLLEALSNFSRGGGSATDGAVLWTDTSMLPVGDKVPVYSPQGLLSTGTPEFPENCVPLSYLNAVTGHYLGLFDTEEELRSAHPTGNHRQHAYVKDIDSHGDVHRYFYWGEMAEDWMPLNRSEDDIHRSTEGLTNKIWVNGKRVYRYVFHNVDIVDDGSVLISLAGLGITEITHFDHTVNQDGVLRKSIASLDISVTNTSLSITPAGVPSEPTSVTVVLEYTK